MKISVCFKVTAEYDEAAKSVWKHPSRLDFSFVKHSFGCFDESALETALRFKEDCKKSGEGIELEAVTLGKENYVLHQGLFARGFDKVTVIHGVSDSLYPRYTAHVLAEYLKDSGPDIIIMGKMAGPDNTGTVPYYLGNELNCPVISDVVSIRFESEGRKTLISKNSEKGKRLYEPMENVICIMNEAEASNLRLFTLMQMNDAQNMQISDIFSSEKEPIGNSIKTEHSSHKTKDCKMINDEALSVMEIRNCLDGGGL